MSVIGCGYLGAVHATSMVKLGHEVVGIDIDSAKISTLSSGRSPFFEPGLDEDLQSALQTGRLRFSADISAAAGALLHFVAVGTPQKAHEDSADLSFLDAAIESLLPHLSPGDLVVGKSTVPVGTAHAVSNKLRGRGALLAWNPEFLREGHAIKDTLSPDRIVYGVPDDPANRKQAVGLLNEAYSQVLAEGVPLIVTSYATAELVKAAANAFLATKISFINAMAEIAEVTGADVTELADAMGLDKRIGRSFLNAGLGFGGGCLPKDIRAFMASTEQLGCGRSIAFLKEIDAINLRRRQRAVDLLVDALQGSVFGKKIAVLGLAFKPDSDDIRDSPALEVAVALHGLGAQVTATDPKAVSNAKQKHPQLTYAATAQEALIGADAVFVATEWRQYIELDPGSAGELVNATLIVDGRNCLDASKWRSAGWTYHGMGRA